MGRFDLEGVGGGCTTLLGRIGFKELVVSSVILAPLAFVAHLGLVAISSFVALARRHCRYQKTEENRKIWIGVVRDTEKRARLLEVADMKVACRWETRVGGGYGLREE